MLQARVDFDDLRAITRELESGGKVQYRPFVDWVRTIESEREMRRPDPRSDARTPARPGDSRVVTARASDRDDSRAMVTRPSDRDDSRLIGARPVDRSSSRSTDRFDARSSDRMDGRPADSTRPNDHAGSRPSVVVAQELLDRLAKGSPGVWLVAEACPPPLGVRVVLVWGPIADIIGPLCNYLCPKWMQICLHVCVARAMMYHISYPPWVRAHGCVSEP